MTLPLPIVDDAAPADPNSEDAFGRCIERLSDIIQAETFLLREGKSLDFDALNQRKSHALLEFIQVSRSVPPQTITRATNRMEHLQRLLMENSELLERRLQATQEITSLIVHHIRESESDGTYTVRSPGIKLK